MRLLKNATLFSPHPLGTVDILLGGERILWIGTSLPALPRGLIEKKWAAGGANL